MTKKSFSKKILVVIFWVIMIISFVFSATLIILKANGYQLNSRTWKINKTGIIILDGPIEGAEVIVNGKTMEQMFPVKLLNLYPRDYEVIVEKSQYNSWQKNIKVEQGKVADYQNITLFLVNPTTYQVNNGINIAKIENEYKNNSKDIKIENDNLFYQDKFITRFSQNILAAAIYPDNAHVVFQIANEIRVIDLDGSNNILLTTLDSSNPTIFSYQNNGDVLVLDIDGVITAKQIR